MKKTISKLLRRKRRSSVADDATSLRITNETVAEHRERVLAVGRKFKYPFHYTRHRIVTITVALVALLIILLSSFLAFQLYVVQDTGDLTYGMTQLLPLPVATIDGQEVRYSDYLLNLRSALYYLTNKEAVNFSSADGRRQLDYQKRQALNKVIADAYAQKLASKLHITVSEQEVTDFVNKQIKSNQLGVSQDTYRQVIKDYYGWTFSDYLNLVAKQLLKVKVEAAIDKTAYQAISNAEQAISQGQDFTQVAKNDSQDLQTRTNGGDIGFVSTSADDPNGIIKVAEQLQVGQSSQIIQGVDGYYLVKLIERHGDQLHLAKIYVRYSEFDSEITNLRKVGKVKEYIKVPDDTSTGNATAGQ